MLRAPHSVPKATGGEGGSDRSEVIANHYWVCVGVRMGVGGGDLRLTKDRAGDKKRTDAMALRSSTSTSFTHIPQ